MRITWKSFITVCFLLLMWNMTGCGGSDKQTVEELNMSWAALEEVPSVSLLEVENTDNSLDPYYARVNAPVRWEEPADALEGAGGINLLLQGERAVLMKKHLFENHERDFDSITVFEGMDKKQVFRFPDENLHSGQLWTAGEVWNSDHMLLFLIPDGAGEGESGLCEVDGSCRLIQEWKVDFLDLDRSEYPTRILADSTGNIHLLAEEYGNEAAGWRYYVLNREGEVIFRYVTEEPAPIMQYTHRGEVVLRQHESTGSLEFLRADISGQTLECVKQLSEKVFQNSLWIATMDDDTMLYVNGEGVFSRDMTAGEDVLLYRWSNHGILVNSVKNMRAAEDGDIYLICANEKGYQHLILGPTVTENSVQTIEFAVNQFTYDKYFPACMEFNRRYPAYHIEMRTDYDQTALNTALISGDGPVLIDTTVTGFGELKQYWQPMEGILEALQLRENLIPVAMELGRIDGELYGIVTDFSINTLISVDKVKDWNYDSLMKLLQSNSKYDYIFDYTGIDDEYVLLYSFFMSDLQDNYFLDAKECSTRFDSPEFRFLLQWMRLHLKERVESPMQAMLEGKALCNRAYIGRPEDIAAIDHSSRGKAGYIGYPAQDGSKHYLRASLPLTIRRTATDEEKRIAYTFLKLLLSYDCQMEASGKLNYKLSVRKDVLEQQIERVEPYMSASYSAKIGTGEKVDKEAVRKNLYYLIENSVIAGDSREGWRSICSEELMSYLSSGISEEMLIDNLNKRCVLYMLENQ